ncbi:hypothetical protein ACWGJ9_10525 [Curtobacterium citreum]
MRRLLRSDRAATDPILVIAAIAVSLVLLVGGSFTVSGLIGNAHTNNAKADLDRIAVAEAAALADGGKYQPYDSIGENELGATTLGKFTLTDGSYASAQTCTTGDGWWAAVQASNGATWVRTSATTAATLAPAATIRIPTCATRAQVDDLIAAVAAWTPDGPDARHTMDLTVLAGTSPVIDVVNPDSQAVFPVAPSTQGTLLIVTSNWAYHWYTFEDNTGDYVGKLVTYADGNAHTVDLLDGDNNYTRDTNAMNDTGSISVFGARYSGGRPTHLIGKNGNTATGSAATPTPYTAIRNWDPEAAYEMVLFPTALTDAQVSKVRQYLTVNYLRPSS